MIEIIPNWHPLFVHFTLALLIVAAALHLLHHFLPKSEFTHQLTTVARWNLWLGAGFTLLTVAAGWYAYNTVAHDTPSHLAMTEHRNWAMTTFVFLLGILGWDLHLSRRGKSRGWLFTGLLLMMAGLLLSTAWHGGELVYRYGLGVMSMPKAEGAGHTHEHGDEQSGEIPATERPVPAKTGHSHAPGTPVHKD